MTENLGDAADLVMQDRVLVEADAYGKLIGFRTVVVKLCPEEVWLGLGAPDRRLEILTEDLPLALTVARARGALVGKSRFLRPLGGSRSRIFAIARPTDLEKVQRRAHIRFDVAMQFHFRSLDPQTKTPRGKALTATTVNLSSGGLLLATDAQLKVGDEVEITLPFSSLDPVTTAGVITRIRVAGDSAGPAEPEAESRIVEAGVKFTRITSVDQERILRFVALLEHRRQAGPGSPTTLPAPVPPLNQPASSPTVSMPAPTAQAAPGAALASALQVAPAPGQVEAAGADRLISLDSRRTTPVVAASPGPARVGEPLGAIGSKLLERGGSEAVRNWFDRLDPPLRIELLSQLQARMAGGAAPSESRPEDVRDLAQALGLLAK
jgi:hypothetical protein